MILPIPKEYWDKVTQPFGVFNEQYESDTHNGVDFSCPIGTPIVAPCDGEIIHRYVNHPTLGKAIYFSCDDSPNYMRFLHLSEVVVQGKYKQGELIGKTGNTGMSEGAHLHLDVWNCPINTGLIKTKSGVFKYMIDPVVFFNNLV